MSEVQSRPLPSRGRGSGRGGRGGYSSRSGARHAKRHSTTNGDAKHNTEAAKSSVEDEGEVGQLKKKFGNKVTLIQEMFADWSEVDILFALQETDGDENLTVTRMAEGTISQWGEVSKPKKDRTKSKTKGDVFTTTTGEPGPAHVRSGRGSRGGVEGGRIRATERGGRSGRGRSAHATNGTRKENVPLSIPTEEASGWEYPQPGDDITTSRWGDDANGWDTPAAVDVVPVDTSTSWDQPAPSFNSTTNNAATLQKTSIIPEGTHKTWASMLRQSTAPKPAPKPKEVAAPEPIEAPIEHLPRAESAPVAVEHEFACASAGEILSDHTTIEAEISEVSSHLAVSEVALPPPTDQLTESNLEQVAGDGITGPATETLKSETASSYDPRAPVASATASPISASQQHHQMPRVPSSGYAATALKATERGVARTPSYQRRILDQEEAVRLPRGREQVERAALQFGAMGLDDEDVDGDREEAETRAQPPDDSPTAHPRTSLPPVQPNTVLDNYSAQKAAAAIPTGPASAVAAPVNVPSHPAASVAPQAVAPAQAPTQPSQYPSRFGHAAPQEQPTFPTPKPFDSFGQTSAPAAQSPYDSGFPHSQHTSQAQSMPQPQQPHQQPSNVFSTAPGEYSTYYTADAQSRSAYNNNHNYYAQGFNQQAVSQAQENASQAQHQQRAYNSYGAPQNENLSQYPQSVAHHAQSRYGNTAGADAQNSGNNTPNPAGPQAQQQTGQNSQGQSHGQQQSHDYASYGSHPYFTSPYYTQYMGAYPGNYNQGGYGAPYGKNHMGYGGQAGYGMQQGPQGYGSSPAGGFETSLRSESGSASGLGGNYGRGGSGGQQGLGGSAFGGVPEAFSRSVSGYQSQASQASQAYSAAGSQPGNGPVADDLKPYGDAKGAGPSPSLATAARPGSAANNGPSQSGLPPPQGAQAGLGGYPGYGSHLQGHGGHGNHGNQSGAGSYGMGGSGNQGGHQNTYGGYGQGFGGGNYYGNQQQARGGWGSNYH